MRPLAQVFLCVREGAGAVPEGGSFSGEIASSISLCDASSERSSL